MIYVRGYNVDGKITVYFSYPINELIQQIDLVARES
jgi:hypothetical protein